MNKGLHGRGYLPHWDYAGAVQAVTFRLGDSVPLSLIEEWKRELVEVGDDELRKKELHRRIARYEDAGKGEAVLRDPRCGGVVQERLIEGNGRDYRLLEWCVMPNHVHVMVKMGGALALAEIVRGWKGGAAFEIRAF